MSASDKTLCQQHVQHTTHLVEGQRKGGHQWEQAEAAKARDAVVVQVKVPHQWTPPIARVAIVGGTT